MPAHWEFPCASVTTPRLTLDALLSSTLRPSNTILKLLLPPTELDWRTPLSNQTSPPLPMNVASVVPLAVKSSLPLLGKKALWASWTVPPPSMVRGGRPPPDCCAAKYHRSRCRQSRH